MNTNRDRRHDSATLHVPEGELLNHEVTECSGIQLLKLITFNFLRKGCRCDVIEFLSTISILDLIQVLIIIDLS